MPGWRYPFVWVAIGWILGSYGIQQGWQVGAILLLILSGAALWMWVALGWSRAVWSLPLFSLIGAVRTHLHHLSQSHQSLEAARGHLVRLSGYLLEEPLRSRKTYRLLLQLDSLHFFLFRQTYRVSGKCLLYVRDSAAQHLMAGTRLRAITRLDTLTYGASYWRQQGVRFMGFTEQVEAIEVEKSYLGGYLERWRSGLHRLLTQHSPLPGPPLALIEALLLGYKRGLDPETRAAFQLSGVAHVLAVSGMHVGIVLSFWLFLFRQLPPTWAHAPLSRLLLMALLVFYGLFTGGAPSAMRAVIMGVVALLAQLTHQPYLALNALGFAAFLQLLLNPFLLHSLSFQLSYAAVLGLLAFYGPLSQAGQKLLPPKKRFVQYAWEVLAVSLAAQLGTFLLSWAHFGQFPLYFLIANLLAVPLATLLAFVGAVWILVLLIGVPLLAPVLGYGSHGLAWLLLFWVKLVSALPAATITLPPLPFSAALIATLGLVSGGFVLQRYLASKAQPWIV
ncbi:MAG: ComEC family competence protein [Bacteroidia bacterium]|nr:ComEC family competence protein [Bacteroidia bacterium]MDW8089562.1 ComEC/Rec2 family competence protein [Bacteroidia bacterium]